MKKASSNAVEERLADGRGDIHLRAFDMAIRILKLVQALPNDLAGQTVARQLGRSGTGAGADIEEAQGPHSRAEFARRMGIARSEARETVYWIRLIAGSGMLPTNRLAELHHQAEEIGKILTSIVKSTRRRQAGDGSR